MRGNTAHKIALKKSTSSKDWWYPQNSKYNRERQNSKMLLKGCLF